MNPADREQVRNETIDELCDWLIGCIEQVDHASDVYKACLAMANGMRKKKTAPIGVVTIPAGGVGGDEPPSHEGQHYPLSSRR